SVTSTPTGQDLMEQVFDSPVSLHVASAAKRNDILRCIVEWVTVFVVQVKRGLAAILTRPTSPLCINRTCARATRIFIHKSVALPVGIEGAKFDFAGAVAIFGAPSSLKLAPPVCRIGLATQCRLSHLLARFRTTFGSRVNGKHMRPTLWALPASDRSGAGTLKDFWGRAMFFYSSPNSGSVFGGQSPLSHNSIILARTCVVY
ncbi:hypothetical protein LCGC14_3096500, partial [marine sediment metagenome]